ncbi:hypothetical protein [Polyangium jinanense]|uniref:Uncharacterized protein n=1 Tax=Polyangium jinanense TaxID=2829994 RepID=A0A9X3X0Y1_9BACT|nr:hypothetical protein [Polyangium jinanense]MDC3952901.1 hypothetical protein [Polyangium jinanense]MDC3980520.1 hypothetical protein [Polyangium jinanense]
MAEALSERGHWKESWKTDAWELLMTSPAHGVFFTRVSGHADLDCALHVMRAFDRLAALTLGDIEVFHDWEHVTGYDSIVRQEFVRWAQEHPKQGEAHILVKSRIVAMGVSVANVALGGRLKAYADRPKFERARTETIASKRRASIPG